MESLRKSKKQSQDKSLEPRFHTQKGSFKPQKHPEYSLLCCIYSTFARSDPILLDITTQAFQLLSLVGFYGHTGFLFDNTISDIALSFYQREYFITFFKLFNSIDPTGPPPALIK